MRYLTLMLLITFVFAWSAPAEAQLFRTKSKTPPAQRIGELIVQAKSDPDERQRAAAAEELRDFDAKAHPEIVSILADVVRTDAKPGVRQEALESLLKIRPVSIIAGQAIERAAAQDDSWKVRWQAKSALLRYQLAGYHPPKNQPNGNNAAKAPMTQEPPLFEAPRPQGKPSAAGRTQPSRPAPRQANVPQGPVPSPPSKIVTQPPLPKIAPPTPRVNVTPTPPPIIVDVPPNPQPVAPRNSVPALPVVDPQPKVNLPPAPPIVAPNSEVIEPNFRPAGQSPPRVPPPPAKKKTEDSGPALTVPM